MLRNKKILLGVTAGIAAYKTPHLVRLLVKQGAEVRVVMSTSASDFVTAKSLSVVSRNEVISDFFNASSQWNNHVHLAEWADIMLIAPLTANTLAKMASGLCDNVLLACYLSARSKTIVAPAMDLDMYQHPTVKRNLETIRTFGNEIIPAETGELASGLSGEGRMAEPENIVEFLKQHFSKILPLSGKKVLINAGPTHEGIDPVRYIGNRSSGKMGLALAEAMADQGAEVTLVLGPVSLDLKNWSGTVDRVESSEEMLNAMLNHFPSSHIVICSAAVADYRPATKSAQKIKKKEEKLQLELVKTTDILARLGELKKQQVLVGFALESENLLQYATEKLNKKNLDLIIANPATEAGVGMGADVNRITIIDRHNKTRKFELQSKKEAARSITDYIINYLSASNEK